MANIMKSANAVSAKRAECFATLNGYRYNFMMMKDLEATVEKKKADVAILGAPMTGSKAVGLSGKFKGTAHYNTTVFKDMMTQYKDEGMDVYFDMQIINEDPTSGIGKQEVWLINCNLDSIILAKFDASSDDPLEESVEGTFEDWTMPEKFDELPNFKEKLGQ